MIDSWCRILGNELLLHGMLIADNDLVPLVEQRIHCCRHYAEEVAYVAEHAASVVGSEMAKSHLNKARQQGEDERYR